VCCTITSLVVVVHQCMMLDNALASTLKWAKAPQHVCQLFHTTVNNTMNCRPPQRVCARSRPPGLLHNLKQQQDLRGSATTPRLPKASTLQQPVLLPQSQRLSQGIPSSTAQADCARLLEDGWGKPVRHRLLQMSPLFIARAPVAARNYEACCWANLPDYGCVPALQLPLRSRMLKFVSPGR